MSLDLIITLFLVAIFLIIFTTHFLKKGRIPEKYSLIWYAFSLIILLLGIFPSVFVFISSKLGFQVMSNLIICIFIGILILFNMLLCIMIAGQKKKATLLIQEVSMLKKRMDFVEESKKNGYK